MGKRWDNSLGFSAAYLVLAVVVLGCIGLIGWLVLNSQRPPASGTGSGSGLVPIDSPDDGRPVPSAGQPVDGLPAGFVLYSEPRLGFSFAYPQAWGGLQPSGGTAAELNLATPRIEGYSLAGSLDLQVEKTANFRIRANDQSVIVAPSPSGGGYEWIVTDKGSSRLSAGKTLTPAPPVVYRSGKAAVYGFSGNEANCSYTMWAFAVKDNFVRLRLPSFCISGKPGDAEVQAGHKADFDKQKEQMLQSVTVF